MDLAVPTDLLFYAVCLPKNVRQSYKPFVPESFISTKKDDVMKILRCHRGARFKTFRCYQKALKFVLEDICDITDNTIGNNGECKKPEMTNHNGNWNPEEPPLFPSIDVRDLNVFKRAITDGDLKAVKTFVWSNPRYLISLNFDSPTIIVQGARYNAVHLAIRTKAPEILDYLLETVNSMAFIERMYGENGTEELLNEKRYHLLDMYLNSPDKANFDTPLHMACKLAQVKCIEILMGYVPMLETEKRNKQGLLPADVVPAGDMKAKICQMLDSSLFIVVERSQDDLSKSINRFESPVGKKLLESKLLSEQSEQCTGRVSALVGPLTPEQSQTVYDLFKSPKRLTPDQRITRIADPRRGLERVVLELSATLNVTYREYWPFLGVYASFDTDEELKLLDEYLERRHDEMALMNRLNFLSIANCSGDDNDDEFFDAKETLESDDEDECFIYHSAPSTPFDSRKRIVMEKDFYINGGSHPDTVDNDIFEMIFGAIQRKKSKINLEKFPFLYWWYHRCLARIKIDKLHHQRGET